jgi:hypothetical protein
MIINEGLLQKVAKQRGINIFTLRYKLLRSFVILFLYELITDSSKETEDMLNYIIEEKKKFNKINYPKSIC